AVLAQDDLPERVALEPARLRRPERGEAPRERERPALARGAPAPEGRERLGDGARRGAEGVRVRHALRRGPVADQLRERPGREERAALAAGEPRERERERVAREERAVVRRGIVGRGDALRAELDAVEAERRRPREEALRAVAVRRAAARVLRRLGGEGRVVDPEEEPADPEERERLAHGGGEGGLHFTRGASGA